MNITKLLLKIVKGIVGIQISVSNWAVGILALRGPLKNMVIVCDYCIRRSLLIKSIHCDIDYNYYDDITRLCIVRDLENLCILVV